MAVLGMTGWLCLTLPVSLSYHIIFGGGIISVMIAFGTNPGIVALGCILPSFAAGIGRILFLEGIPIVSKLKDIHIGADVSKQINNDWRSEADAIKAYNDAIKLAAEVGDNATRDILIEILNEEDAHIDKIEEIKDQIEQMGIGIFLSTQTV